jgi:sporulation protein YlmC with PRC-barrel domain
MNQRIELGAQVWATDSKVGRVAKIIVDPQRKQAGSLVVKQGRFRSRRIVVPTNLMAGASPGRVVLAMTAAALENFPDYERGLRHKPSHVNAPEALATYTRSYDEGEIIRREPGSAQTRRWVVRDMDVRDAHGVKLGRVHELFQVGSEVQISHIVMRDLEERTPPARPPAYRIVPVELVADVEDNGIRLRIAAPFVYGLSTYWPRTGVNTKVSIEPGAAVIASGGERVGEIGGLVLASEGEMISHIIVRPRQQAPGPRNLTVPVEQVANVQHGEITLRMTTNALRLRECRQRQDTNVARLIFLPPQRTPRLFGDESTSPRPAS